MKAPAVETLIETSIRPAEITLLFPWEGGPAAISTEMAEVLYGPYWGYRGAVVQATHTWADPEGRLWVGRRKAAGRPDAGRPCALRPLLLRIEVLTPGPNRYSPRIKEVHQVHLRVTSPETATAGDVHEAAMAILAGLTPDPGYLLQRAQVLRERAQQEAERAADRAAEAEEKARALARAKQQVQEAKLHPELKMLRAQPRKGERWAKAWRNALRRLLGRDGLTTEEARGLLHIEGE